MQRAHLDGKRWPYLDGKLLLLSICVPSKLSVDDFPVLVTECHPCDIHGKLINGLREGEGKICKLLKTSLVYKYCTGSDGYLIQILVCKCPGNF